MSTEQMHQEAPYPTALAELVAELKYRPGWEFSLVDRDRGQGSKGLTLAILIDCEDTYHPGRRMLVYHYMIVPPAAYDKRSWRRWLFEQVLLVERHEAMEFFRIGNERPFAPHHQPGADCYDIRETTDLERRTNYRGELEEK